MEGVETTIRPRALESTTWVNHKVHSFPWNSTVRFTWRRAASAERRSGALLLRELMDRLGYRGCSRSTCETRGRCAGHAPVRRAGAHRAAAAGPGVERSTDVRLLRDDPALRLAVSSRRGQRPLREAAGDARRKGCARSRPSAVWCRTSGCRRTWRAGSVVLWTRRGRLGLGRVSAGGRPRWTWIRCRTRSSASSRGAPGTGTTGCAATTRWWYARKWGDTWVRSCGRERAHGRRRAGLRAAGAAPGPGVGGAGVAAD